MLLPKAGRSFSTKQDDKKPSRPQKPWRKKACVCLVSLAALLLHERGRMQMVARHQPRLLNPDWGMTSSIVVLCLLGWLA